MKRNIILTFLFLVTLLPLSRATLPDDGSRFTISGNIRDKGNGEELTGASVYIKELQTGTVSNVYGFYSISLLPGNYTISYYFLGYNTVIQNVKLQQNLTLNIELEPKQQVLKEVEITGERKGEDLKKPEMSTVKMDVKRIREIPALMGEVDIIKAIQLLPGVQTASEGSSGFSVRGGSPDQNLILLDEATVYNASHLMGFFSVFNNDAIKDVVLYKGDIPASYGGRLSSLLDVRMKDGNSKQFSGTGGIGTISSRLTLEGPLMDDKISWIISGRRTYADLFLVFAKDKDLRDNTLYFYDLNTKINYRINENNRLFFSGYYGKDVFKNPDFGMNWGNRTFTLRWNHLFTKQLFSNFTLINSKYDYNLGVPEGTANSFNWSSDLVDYSAKADFSFYPDPNNTVRFGFSSTLHNFNPGTAEGLGSETIFTKFVVPKIHSLEHALYISNEQKLGARFTVKYGLRYSIFQNIGEGTIYRFDQQYNAVDSTVYAKGKIFKTYSGIEPRAGLIYQLTETSSFKASYSRTMQYIHLATNATAGTPLDVWFPSDPNIRPQVADQGALGYFRNFRDNAIEVSVEGYYKAISHAIDFKDHAVLLLNKKLDGELRFGNAWSYGAEFCVKLNLPRVNGWISYTLSKSERKIPGINEGKVYRSPYDKPHNVSVVLNYNLSKRIDLGATWVYASGAPVTFPTGRAEIGGNIVPVYSDRNAYRMPDYHRLDLSFTLRGKEKPGRRFQGEWNVSIYNAYARKNAWAINFRQDENDPSVTYAEKTYLFSIIPSITYNFHF